MSILSKVSDFIGGGLFKEIKELTLSYLPPSMSEQQKMEFELKLSESLHQKALEADRIINESSQLLNQRIAEQEGTAKDLMAMGWLGKPIIFLRGFQRIAWGFGILYMDYKWFDGDFDKVLDNVLVAPTEQQQTALIVINVLVLGFLFGERAIKNLEPLLIKVFSK